MSRRAVLLFVLLATTAFSLLLVSREYHGDRLFYNGSTTPSTASTGGGGMRRALIVDGIRGVRFTGNFTDEARKLLEGLGYTVDVVQGEEVEVGFLLSVGHYDIYVLRLHSAVHDGTLYVFSGELYAESKYTLEQLTGMVRKAYVLSGDEPPYFALNAVFLGARNPDGLRNSIVILMGCSGARDQLFIRALLERGVKAYIAWDGYVSIAHSDKATLELLKALIRDRLSPEEAVGKVMEIAGPDPVYGARLHCFVSQGSDLPTPQ